MSYDDPNGFHSENSQNDPYQNHSYQDNPYGDDPYQNNQYQNNPYHNNPYQNNQYQNDPYQNNSYRSPDRPNALATASLVLGIIGIVGSACLYLAIPFSALGILFAILSRDKNHQMHGRARIGLGISIAGLVISLILTVYVFMTYLPYIQSGQFQQYLEEYMDRYYGEDDSYSIPDDGSSGYGSGTLDDWLEEFGDDFGWYGGGGSYSPYDGGGSYSGDTYGTL